MIRLTILLAVVIAASCATDPVADCATGGCAEGCADAIVAPIDEALERGECQLWLDTTRGRVGAQDFASLAVVSRRTRDQLGLFVSALHTLSPGSLGDAGVDIAASLAAPAETSPLLARIPPVDGGIELDDLSPIYVMGHPDVPATENGASWDGLRPAHDFFFGVVDRQRVTRRDNGPRVDAEVPLFDPGEITLADDPWAEPVPGERAIAIGFPQVGFDLGAYSVGTILSDAEAEAAIAVHAGTDEGEIPYDAEVELLIATDAVVGMSGGGVFDERGRFLGTIVRATLGDEPRLIRAVRFTYVAQRVRELAAALPAAARDAVAPFLDAALAPPGAEL